MTRSLRQRFVWVLGVSSMLAWSLLALWQAAQIGTQVDALFEAHIAEGAKILEALVRSESLEYPPGTGPPPIARIPGRDPTAAGGVEDRAFTRRWSRFRSLWPVCPSIYQDERAPL